MGTLTGSRALGAQSYEKGHSWGELGLTHRWWPWCPRATPWQLCRRSKRKPLRGPCSAMSLRPLLSRFHCARCEGGMSLGPAHCHEQTARVGPGSLPSAQVLLLPLLSKHQCQPSHGDKTGCVASATGSSKQSHSLGCPREQRAVRPALGRQTRAHRRACWQDAAVNPEFSTSAGHSASRTRTPRAHRPVTVPGALRGP